MENIEKMEDNENREFYVYEHIRLDNMTCFYIGKGKGERAYDLARNYHHDNISNIHGHVVVIIKDNLTEEEAFELERDTIEDYVFNLGYGIDIEGYKDYDHELPHLTNMTWGGEGISGVHKGIQLSEEHKKKISESHKGTHHSEETKLKISEANKGKQAGKNHHLYGKHRSDEIKQKISEAHKGRHHSEETKLKMSESRKGKNNPMYGKKLSEEKKLKMSEACKQKLSKKVICIITGEIFNSQKEAENYYNVGNISKCCRGIRKSAGKLQDGTKLQWKFLEDYNNDFKGILINPITE